MKRLAIILVLIFFAFPLYATDYYVDVTTGDDSDSGLTEELAWKTMGKVDSFDAATGFAPGDNIYFKAGETWSGANAAKLSITSSGTDGSPITFGKYGAGALPIFTYGSDTIFYGYGLDWIVIQDLEFDGNLSGVYNGVQFGNALSTNIIIQRCVIYGCRNGMPLHMCDTVTVDDCTIYSCNNSGIILQGSASSPISNVIIQNCEIYNIIANDGIALHMDGSLNNIGSNFYIYNNVIYNCEEQGVDITSGNNVLLVDNETYDNTVSSVVTGHGSYDVFITKHYSHSEDKYSLYFSSRPGIRVLQSVVYAPIRSCFDIGAASASDDHVANNTFVSTSASTRNTVQLEDYCEGAVIKNNIIMSNDTVAPTQLVKIAASASGESFDYNQYYRADNDNTQTLWDALNWADWQTAGYDANGAFGDPTLTDIIGGDFSLVVGSPCINNGGWLTTITTANGSGTTFTVADSKWFHDGFGLTTGSEIQLERDVTTTTVTAVNWSTGVITVADSVSWTQGDGVAFPFENGTPDIGANEYGGEAPPGGDPAGNRNAVLKSGTKLILGTGLKVIIK